jgi:hypothetical protein
MRYIPGWDFRRFSAAGTGQWNRAAFADAIVATPVG